MGKARVVLEPLLEVQENSLEHGETMGRNVAAPFQRLFIAYLPVVKSNYLSC